MRFQDIKPYTRHSCYMVHVGLDYLARHVARYVLEYGLDMSPDFQRGYVWTPEQKTRFVEHMLREGKSGMAIYINCPSWNRVLERNSNCVLVDGKQRLDAALGFLNNEVPVFGGHYFRDFTDSPRMTGVRFEWHVNDLQTREECLQWYIEMNSGGTVHTDEELEKVRAYITKSVPYVTPSKEELVSVARLDRPVFAEALREIEEEKERTRLSLEKSKAEAAEKAIKDAEKAARKAKRDKKLPK